MASREPRPDESVFADESSRELFERFTRRLIGLARNHLHAQLQHKVDPEDVVQSAYKSFFLRYGEEAVDGQRIDDLWNLLSLITLRKCADRVRHYRAERRDISRESPATLGDHAEPLQAAMAREPLPEHAAALAETVEQMLAELVPAERPIVELSLQGFSTREVSEHLGRAERSVRRVRQRVKRRLECL